MSYELDTDLLHALKGVYGIMLDIRITHLLSPDIYVPEHLPSDEQLARWRRAITNIMLQRGSRQETTIMLRDTPRCIIFSVPFKRLYRTYTAYRTSAGEVLQQFSWKTNAQLAVASYTVEGLIVTALQHASVVWTVDQTFSWPEVWCLY